MKTASDFFVRRLKPRPGTCFVLMPFAEGLTAVYEHGIKPLVESMGMECKRADEVYTAQGILGDIWDSIQTAEIIIADLTNKNPNVMYELGLCHTLWKRVILLSQNKDDVPFDLRAWRVIWYDFSFTGATRLKEALQQAIMALRKEDNTESELVPLTLTGELAGKKPVKPAGIPPGSSSDWVDGFITSWKPNDMFGFIEANGESFYFNQTYLFSATMEVAENSDVVFIPLQPIQEGKHRRASRVFVVGSKLIGRVTRIIPGKGFGFADVVGDTRGEIQNLFILVDDEVSLKVGTQIEFTVDFNDRGPIGREVAPLT